METLIKKGTIVRHKSGKDNSGIPGGELFDVVYRIPRSRSIDSKKQIVVFGEKSAANTFEYYWKNEEDYIPVQLKNVSKEYKKDIQFKLNKLTSKKSKGTSTMKNTKNSTRKASRTASKKTLTSSIPTFIISVAKDLTSKVKSLNKKVDSKELTTGVAIKNGNTTVLTLNKVNSKGIGQLCFNKLSVKEVKPLTSLKVEKIQDQYTVIKNFSVEDFGKVKNAVKKALTISNSEK